MEGSGPKVQVPSSSSKIYKWKPVVEGHQIEPRQLEPSIFSIKCKLGNKDGYEMKIFILLFLIPNYVSLFLCLFFQYQTRISGSLKNMDFKVTQTSLGRIKLQA